MKTKLTTLLVLLAFLSLSVYSHAQEEHPFTLSFGGGFSPLIGDISSRLNNGWHIMVGGGYNFNRYFSTSLDYNYNGFGVSQRVLNEAQVPGGNSHLWSLTVNPKLRFAVSGKVTPYIVGGVGYYRRTVQFTQPAVTPVLLFDPFFGTFFNTLVPADQVLGSITRSGIGGSAGGGFDVKLGQTGLKFFTEARYTYANTGNIPTRLIPVTFGIRW